MLPLVAAMATPHGVWRVDVLRTRSGEVFHVHRRAVIGVHGGAGWAPSGQIRRTVGEVPTMVSNAFCGLGRTPTVTMFLLIALIASVFAAGAGLIIWRLAGSSSDTYDPTRFDRRGLADRA